MDERARLNWKTMRPWTDEELQEIHDAVADPIYEAMRNKIIPRAAEVADRIAGPAPQRVDDSPAATRALHRERAVWSERWDRAFHAAMAELWAGRAGRVTVASA